MKYDILNIFSGAVQFTADIDCDENEVISLKIGLAVKWAIKNDADLCDADLCGADLCGADLCGANVRGADLRGADLRDADLRGADLCGADLRDADLRGANLRGADLRDADLRDADLRVYQTDIWTCYIQKENIRIGCQYHTVDAWLNMSDDNISAMDSRALTWWNIHKPAIIAIHNTLKGAE